MFIKTNKTVKRITAWLCMLAMMLGMMVTGTSPVYAADGRKIDVWDFGCVQESDTNTYVNHITTAEIEGWTDVSASGSISSGATKSFGDLSVIYVSGDRYYGPVKNYGSVAIATNAYADGYKANGMYYCGGTGGDNRRCITIDNVVAGDKIVAYIGTTKAATDPMYFEYMGTDGNQRVESTVSETAAKHEFVAKYSGTYKIWVYKGGA